MARTRSPLLTTSGKIAALGVVVCGAATVALMAGPGGWNARTQTCAALIALGFVTFIVFYVLASREHYSELAARVGMRHVKDYTGDIAFEAEPDGVPMRFEFSPPSDHRCDFHTGKFTLGLHLPPDLQVSVSGKNVMTRDIGGMIKGLPRIDTGLPWLQGHGVYGQPAQTAVHALSRLAELTPLREADWELMHFTISDGTLYIRALSRSFYVEAEPLRQALDACAKIAAAARS